MSEPACLELLTEEFHACCGVWLRGTVAERQSVTGELSLSNARPAADG